MASKNQPPSNWVSTTGKEVQYSSQISTPVKEIQQLSSHSMTPPPHSPNKSTSPFLPPYFFVEQTRQYYVEFCFVVAADDNFEGNGARDWPNESRLCCLDIEEACQYRDKYIWVKSINRILRSPWSLKYNKKKDTYNRALDWELVLMTFNGKNSWNEITTGSPLQTTFLRKTRGMKKLIRVHNDRVRVQSLQQRIMTTRKFVRLPSAQTSEDRERGPGYSSQTRLFSFVPLQDELVIFYVGGGGHRVGVRFSPCPNPNVAFALEFLPKIIFPKMASRKFNDLILGIHGYSQQEMKNMMMVGIIGRLRLVIERRRVKRLRVVLRDWRLSLWKNNWVSSIPPLTAAAVTIRTEWRAAYQLLGYWKWQLATDKRK